MISFKKAVLALLVTLTGTTPLLQAANVVFDLGGVLVDTKKMKAAGSIGFFNLIAYAGNPTSLFFNFLEQINPRKATTPLACDEHGNLLPQYMCDWMTGAANGSAIARSIYQALDANTKLNWTEYRVIEGMATMIFDDIDTYLATKKIIKSGLKFAQECKDAGHKLYILSNWDSASFDQLKKLYPDAFKFFDGEIISGKVGALKPDPAIFNILLDTYKLNPADTIFIDDQPENIKTAQQMGFGTIHCTKKKSIFKSKPDYKKVREEFNDWCDSRAVAA